MWYSVATAWQEGQRLFPLPGRVRDRGRPTGHTGSRLLANNDGVELRPTCGPLPYYNRTLMRHRRSNGTVCGKALSAPSPSRTTPSTGGRRGSAGQGLVEFALIVPLLLVIVLGIINFGHVFAVHASLVNAAREAARYGMVNPTDAAGICNRVVETAFLTSPELNTITVSYGNSEDDLDIEGIELLCDDEDLENGIVANQLRGGGDDPGRDRVSVRVVHDLSALVPLFRDSFDIDVGARRTIARVRE